MNMKRPVYASLLFVLMLASFAYAAFNLSIPVSFNVVTSPSVVAVPSSLSFGNIVQNTTATQSFILTNNGGSSATGIACTWVWTGTTPAGVTVDPVICPASLSPATSATVSITIRVGPMVTTGLYSGSVSIAYN